VRDAKLEHNPGPPLQLPRIAGRGPRQKLRLVNCRADARGDDVLAHAAKQHQPAHQPEGDSAGPERSHTAATFFISG